MNFTVSREIKNGVFKVEVAFSSYGSETFTKEGEEELLKKYGCPIIDSGGEPFIARLIHDEEADMIKVDSEGEESILILNSSISPVNDKFKVSYSIDANKIKDAELTKTLDTPLKMAEGKCVLFEEGVLERIADALEGIKNKVTSFEKGYPEEITI